tara:strand:- start:228 stop:428 length:201 start_codon:yes stop_codon:yes gene_type:complete
MSFIPARLKSRKFIAAFCGAIMPPILAYLNQEIALAEMITLSVAVVISYIFGQGAVDYAAAKNGNG